MSTERDELKAIVADALSNPQHGEFALDSTRVAARVLAAGYRRPRQVTTVEELDALPVLSVVLDKHGESYQKLVTDEGATSPLWMAGDIVLSSLIDLPATVIHVGGAE